MRYICKSILTNMISIIVNIYRFYVPNICFLLKLYVHLKRMYILSLLDRVFCNVGQSQLVDSVLQSSTSFNNFFPFGLLFFSVRKEHFHLQLNLWICAFLLSFLLEFAFLHSLLQLISTVDCEVHTIEYCEPNCVPTNLYVETISPRNLRM